MRPVSDREIDDRKEDPSSYLTPAMSSSLNVDI